ncbi:MAG TPA: glycosyltransferase family 39 protein [Candidatus Limnocylindria bacterium]
MSSRVRDLVVLAAVALLVRAIAVAVVPWPPFTDPAYYSLIAQRLAEGHGFTSPVLWSFIEVGSVLPDPATLPVPSNAHWMPLTSIVAAASMALLGPTYVAGTIPLVILSALLVPFTYAIARELWASRWTAVVAAVLALFAGPLLVMYPTTDNFAVFGATGAGSLYASMRAVRAPRPGPWLVLGGALAGLATLSRIDGAFLTVGVATAWFVRRGWSPWRAPAIGGATVGWGAASAAAFLAVLAPWIARNLAVFGAPLPSAGGHTLWITSYNQQFSIGQDVSLSTYLDWGLGNIVLSKLTSWAELVGRTGVLLGGTFLVFFVAGVWMFRRRAELAPFLAYFAVMFVLMGAIFTFHAPKGAFYHSAPAWLPWAFGISAAAVGPTLTAVGRFWPFLRRPATHRFVTVAAVAGAVVLSVVGSAILFAQWDRSRHRDEQAAAFLRANAAPGDVIMASDPASLEPLTGNPGVAAPFDPFRIIGQVVDAYDVRWVVVLRPGPGENDPLNLWNGSAGTDSEGAHPAFLPDAPAFEGDDVRIFEVTD